MLTLKKYLIVAGCTVTLGCNLFSSSEVFDAGSPVDDMSARDVGPSDSGAADSGTDAAAMLDATQRDQDSPDASMPFDACAPDSDAAICARAGANCGTVEVTDNCGEARSVSCGECTAPNTCGAVQANVCGCVGETDQEFCDRLGKNCGTVVDIDQCGAVRSADCGTCTSPDTCGNDNVCACVGESDAEFCSRQGKDCGSLSGQDNCDMARTANCGTCPNNEVCGELQPNVCGCACQINSVCYGEGAVNPNNPCESCNSAMSDTAWSIRAGASCDDGDGCTTGDVCDSSGGCAGTPVVCNGGECADSVCNPANGQCVTTPKTDLTPCTDDGATCTADYCIAGVCEHPVTAGCFIDGTCYDSNFAPDGCRRCKPQTNDTNWTVGAGCAIDGACWTSGADNPSNPCEVCDEVIDPLGWTVKPDDRPCAPNMACVCQSGVCEDATTGGACTN